jgi:MATE family multidrug resistance protein
MINNIAGYALAIVGAIYIGRLGALPLSASVLANSLYNCTGLSLALGLSAGMETLCGAAYGAGAYLRVGVILQRALLVCWTVCLPVVLLWSQVCAFGTGCHAPAGQALSFSSCTWHQIQA